MLLSGFCFVGIFPTSPSVPCSQPQPPERSEGLFTECFAGSVDRAVDSGTHIFSSIKLKYFCSRRTFSRFLFFFFSFKGLISLCSSSERTL